MRKLLVFVATEFCEATVFEVQAACEGAISFLIHSSSEGTPQKGILVLCRLFEHPIFFDRTYRRNRCDVEPASGCMTACESPSVVGIYLKSLSAQRELRTVVLQA
jgi:hypothetical protein